MNENERKIIMANASSDLSVAIANEAKVAYLDAVAAQIDFVKEYGSFD